MTSMKRMVKSIILIFCKDTNNSALRQIFQALLAIPKPLQYLTIYIAVIRIKIIP
jgi:hypothetical protein